MYKQGFALEVYTMFKILVVEDDRDLNRSVCYFLNHSGYEAIGCLSADEAYDEMYKNTFDLIISDIMMPGTDGYEFARTIRSLNENIPILFMSARDDLASKQRGFRIGIDDYMTKPIDLDELFLRIPMTSREFNILYKLLSYPKRTFTRTQLMDEFWDVDTETAPRAVDVYMTKLRSKLSDCNDFEIQTVHGLGYKAVIK